MLNDFYSLFFPRTCLNCSKSLSSEELDLCLKCKISLPLTDDYRNDNNDLFKKFAFEPKIKSARAFMYFYKQGISQKILHHLKYQNKCSLGKLLGTWMATEYPRSTIDYVIPVPIHRKKLKKRGYNQSECLVDGFCETSTIPKAIDFISRESEAISQTTRNKVERWQNIQNVYSEASPEVAGKSILIVDDVITTGATVGMMAERLVEKEVKEIHILSLARGQ